MTAPRYPAPLAALLVLCAFPALAYDRPSWGDEDRDCRDTRAEVLAKQCASVTWAPSGCRVESATCRDLYSGAWISAPASALHVDHVFPAGVAAGRKAWAPGEFRRFFNDEENLLATTRRTNLRKSDRMPHEWCPALRGGRILAAARFRKTAEKYRLPLTAEEVAGLRAWERGECAPGAVVLGDDRP